MTAALTDVGLRSLVRAVAEDSAVGCRDWRKIMDLERAVGAAGLGAPERHLELGCTLAEAGLTARPDAEDFEPGRWKPGENLFPFYDPAAREVWLAKNRAEHVPESRWFAWDPPPLGLVVERFDGWEDGPPSFGMSSRDHRQWRAGRPFKWVLYGVVSGTASYPFTTSLEHDCPHCSCRQFSWSAGFWKVDLYYLMRNGVVEPLRGDGSESWTDGGGEEVSVCVGGQNPASYRASSIVVPDAVRRPELRGLPRGGH